MDLSFNENTETGNLHVDGKAPCGKEFKDVAIVLEPKSENPGLVLEQPLGFMAVKAILDYVGRRRRGCEKLN